MPKARFLIQLAEAERKARKNPDAPPDELDSHFTDGYELWKLGDDPCKLALSQYWQFIARAEGENSGAAVRALREQLQ